VTPGNFATGTEYWDFDFTLSSRIPSWNQYWRPEEGAAGDYDSFERKADDAPYDNYPSAEFAPILPNGFTS
jgi:hypothetical protein